VESTFIGKREIQMAIEGNVYMQFFRVTREWRALELEGIHSRCCGYLVWILKCIKKQFVGPIE
jgi:hypothetical protein